MHLARGLGFYRLEFLSSSFEGFCIVRNDTFGNTSSTNESFECPKKGLGCLIFHYVWCMARTAAQVNGQI